MTTGQVPVRSVYRRLAWVGLALIAAGAVAVASWIHFRDARPAGPRSAWLKTAKPDQVGRCRCEAGEDVTIMRADGLKLAGSIDRPKESGTHPVLVLLHGNTPRGRRLSVYRVLARELVRHGLIVLTVDFAGFGESADPFELGSVRALDKVLDARAALEFARHIPGADTDAIQLVCHSMGCRPAFAIGVTDSKLTRIVAIGPPRRDPDRKNDDENLEYFWKRAKQTRRTIHHKDFPDWYTREMWVSSVQAERMEDFIPALSQPAHIPVLFIDGARESKEVRKYLREYAAGLAEPKCYVTIPNADHYLNTVRAGGEHIYDRVALDILVAEILRADSPCAPVKRANPPP